LTTLASTLCDRLAATRGSRLAILLAGIVTSQVILYGHSLIGTKILLPLDLLALPNVYLPMASETRGIVPHDVVQSDLAYLVEPERHFVASELRAGHWPMWVPGQYAGKPVLQGPWLSPLSLLLAAFPSPVVLAWHQLLAAIIAGVGFYLFCRRALGVGFWPAVVTAWNYPITGFFVFWLGYPTCASVYFLPWMAFAIDGVIRRTTLAGMVALGLTTCALLCNRQLDVAGQTLVVCGLFGVWRTCETYWGSLLGRQARKAGLLLLAGWLLGFALAAPYVLPVLDYVREGSRIEARLRGVEERPPGSLAALPLLVLPDANGASRRGSYPLPPAYQIESLSAAYAGLISTLFLAPLAWWSRRSRSFAVFSTGLVIVALAWGLDFGGIVFILRLPWLNAMSYNRLVFAASFAILAMAAGGLESLVEPLGPVRRHRLLVPAVLLVTLASWWFYRAANLPEPIASEIGKMLAEGKSQPWIEDEAGVRQVQSWFSRVYILGGLLAVVAALGWIVLGLRGSWRPWMSALLGSVMFVDMLWFAHDRSAQCDPSLYYPRVPFLQKLASITAGRVVAFENLPATLAQMSGLRDVRGCDGVDPRRYFQLVQIAAEPTPNDFAYAHLQYMLPKISYPTPDSVRLSPVMDLLGVEYVIFRRAIPESFKPALVESDYWAMKNPSALPHVFVPRHVESVSDDKERLAKLSAPSFEPSEVAYVEMPVALPDVARGKTIILAEKHTEITVSANMETPGLVVLSDSWNTGWRCRLNGEEVPILRVDHALRGVLVPDGKNIVKFTYEPASLRWGLALFVLALAAILACLGVEWCHRRRRAPISLDLP
jgi:hypothetical protein